MCNVARSPNMFRGNLQYHRYYIFDINQKDFRHDIKKMKEELYSEKQFPFAENKSFSILCWSKILPQFKQNAWR